ncbi:MULTISPECIES: TetR/AcrR family transcriptional regulator [Streptomyces]|uniref:TetR/AcrR family transcriptional regulator n=1 Tax=Streptomyces TaxID=1883 RepID=UPI0022499DAB|nr:TetR/AcrR family transcriptional regulator [Streptomyces sp. JHD 1]MCX2968863.1 TetR/AcrR family transcriptional regulator [Streptomyces sp. JHD 1]
MSPRPRSFEVEEVLDAAMGTFWDNGYADTSAQDLVDSTGLGRGSLYNTFTSKNGLFEAVLGRYRAEYTTRLVAALEEGESPARERIRAVLLGVVAEEAAGASGRRGCLVVNSAMELGGRDERITELVRENVARIEAALAACVEQGHRDGSIEPEREPRAFARYLLNALYGLRVLGRVADRQTLLDVVEQTLPPRPAGPQTAPETGQER